MKIKYECCECGWTGLHSEKDLKPGNEESSFKTYVCPECENVSFYEIENEEVIIKCDEFEICSMNSDANCFKGSIKSAKKTLHKNPGLCEKCVYNEDSLLSDAIQFGNYLNKNAEKWGDKWVLDNGKNYTTAELYRKFKELSDKKK